MVTVTSVIAEHAIAATVQVGDGRMAICGCAEQMPLGRHSVHVAGQVLAAGAVILTGQQSDALDQARLAQAEMLRAVEALDEARTRCAFAQRAWASARDVLALDMCGVPAEDGVVDAEIQDEDDDADECAEDCIRAPVHASACGPYCDRAPQHTGRSAG